MVNIRELRIGNWVYNKYHGQNIKITPFDFFTHGHDPDGYQFIVQSYSITTGRDLEPIPLTAGILEKNGWLYQKYPDDEMFIWPVDDDIEMPFRLLVGLDGNRYWVTAGIGGLVCPINCVHQLQNILIDLGIDKEIIL